MLEQLIGQVVVVDMRSPFVCIGTLKSFDDAWLELRNADMHDLRDTPTSREHYVAEARLTGVKRNRRRVLLARAEVAAIALLHRSGGFDLVLASVAALTVITLIGVTAIAVLVSGVESRALAPQPAE